VAGGFGRPLQLSLVIRWSSTEGGLLPQDSCFPVHAYDSYTVTDGIKHPPGGCSGRVAPPAGRAAARVAAGAPKRLGLRDHGRQHRRWAAVATQRAVCEAICSKHLTQILYRPKPTSNNPTPIHPPKKQPTGSFTASRASSPCPSSSRALRPPSRRPGSNPFCTAAAQPPPAPQ
jgi:hypothetical protein